MDDEQVFVRVVRNLRARSGREEFRTIFQIASLGLGMDDRTNAGLVQRMILARAGYFRVRRGGPGILDKYCPDWERIGADRPELLDGSATAGGPPDRRRGKVRRRGLATEIAPRIDRDESDPERIARRVQARRADLSALIVTRDD